MSDQKIATIWFYVFLLPTIVLCFLSLGYIVMIILMMIGVITGSAAASGTWVLMGAIFTTPFAIGLVLLQKDFYRRMRK